MTDTTTSYFQDVAPRWDELRSTLFGDEVREAAFARAGLEPGRLAADLGAGTGFLTEGLLDRGLRVIAVDPAEAMLTELARKLGPRPGLELRQGSVERLPIVEGSVDYAFANMVLHHIEDPAAGIAAMVRTLAPGGRLILTDLDEHPYEFLRREQHDRWLGFRRDDVARWLEEAGLEGVRVESTGERCCSTSCCGGERAAVTVFVASGRRPAAPGDEQGRLDEAIRRHYADAARRASRGETAGCGCGCKSDEAGASGELPAAATAASLGCGSPTEIAALAPGEVVLDLGSGGGRDLLLAARQVGPSGKVYGLDMTPEMVELARRNLRAAGATQAEVIEGRLERIPLPADGVDVVISNCVLNLSLDKPRALAEAFRVLRPGGRLAVADIVTTAPLPEALRHQVELWSACVAGAMSVDEYRATLAAAGFEQIEIELLGSYGAEDLAEAEAATLARWLAQAGLGDAGSLPRVASAHVRARKPVRN